VLVNALDRDQPPDPAMSSQDHLAEATRAEGSHELVSLRKWKFLLGHGG
jgi:hypothetical protein